MRTTIDREVLEQALRILDDFGGPLENPTRNERYGKLVVTQQLRAALAAQQEPEKVEAEVLRLNGGGGEAVALRQENELLRTALRFYANGDHYNLDEDEEFDTVSGEPQSWLCSGLEDSQTMVENGEVARYTLMGQVIGWEDDSEDHTPQPIPGEAPFSAAALQTAYNIRPQKAAPQPQQAAPGAVLEGWRTIETAPKDGTFYLAHDEEYGLFV